MCVTLTLSQTRLNFILIQIPLTSFHPYQMQQWKNHTFTASTIKRSLGFNPLLTFKHCESVYVCVCGCFFMFVPAELQALFYIYISWHSFDRALGQEVTLHLQQFLKLESQCCFCCVANACITVCVGLLNYTSGGTQNKIYTFILKIIQGSLVGRVSL